MARKKVIKESEVLGFAEYFENMDEKAPEVIAQISTLKVLSKVNPSEQDLQHNLPIIQSIYDSLDAMTRKRANDCVFLKTNKEQRFGKKSVKIKTDILKQVSEIEGKNIDERLKVLLDFYRLNKDKVDS